MVESLYLNWTSSILFILGDWGQLVVKSVNKDSSIHCCNWYGPVSECIRNLRCSSTQDASHNQDGISFLIGDHLKYSQTKEELDMSGDGQTYGRGFYVSVFFSVTRLGPRWKGDESCLFSLGIFPGTLFSNPLFPWIHPRKLTWIPKMIFWKRKKWHL